MEAKFTQPCLIKKNTKTLRKKLEAMGYIYAPLKSSRQTYGNTKEPWIVCAYDIYTCTDKEFMEDFREEISNLSEMMTELNIQGISTDVLEFTRHEEEQFLECAAKK